MKQFVELLHLRRKSDYDNFIPVTGLKGVGKSTFLYHLGNEYMKALGRKFDIEHHVIYSDSFEEIFDKIKNARDGDYLWFDEGGRILLAEDWNSARSKRLKKLFAEVRTRHLTVGFAIPFSFLRIDKKYREGLFNFWVWIPLRGFSLVFQPLIHPTQTGFMEEEINKKIRPLAWSDTLKESAENYFYEALRKFPSFMDVIRYPEMPKKIHEKYLELRDKAVYDESEEEEQSKIKRAEEGFVKLVDYIRKKYNVEVREIFQELETQYFDSESMRAAYYQLKKRFDSV